LIQELPYHADAVLDLIAAFVHFGGRHVAPGQQVKLVRGIDQAIAQ
jgi:hypothetical protein